MASFRMQFRKSPQLLCLFWMCKLLIDYVSGLHGTFSLHVTACEGGPLTSSGTNLVTSRSNLAKFREMKNFDLVNWKTWIGEMKNAIKSRSWKDFFLISDKKILFKKITTKQICRQKIIEYHFCHFVLPSTLMNVYGSPVWMEAPSDFTAYFFSFWPLHFTPYCGGAFLVLTV